MDRLKTIHLLYILVAAVLAVGVAWGGLAKQQENNSRAIGEKASKEVLEMHIQTQTQQFQSLESTINSGFSRIDTRLDTIEGK